MPKMKSHRGAAKRIRRTGSGKLLRRQSNRAHLLEKKSSSRKRRLGGTIAVAAGDARRAKRMLGG